jgi:glycosyltransferase involved in cell wall biosynthesis
LSATPLPIERPYLLICPLPHAAAADGSIWLDRLWHHDLQEHLSYLRSFVLVSPRLQGLVPADWVRVDPPPGVRFETVAIPPLDSFSQAIRSLPRMLRILWTAIGRVDVVHSGVGGWPIALGWLANPIALLRGKTLVVVVESAFWRIPEGQPASWKARLRSRITEGLARFFVNRAHLLWFTQPSYRRTLLTRGRGQVSIVPATWVNEQDVLSDDEAARSWDAKPAQPRFLFAGRLVREKGIDVLLAALRRLDGEGAALRVDVIGDGPEREACAAAAAGLRSVKCSLLSPVPYGPQFFSLLRGCHAVVIPSRSDEQPRLVFDAFSQAVPVLASRTDGLAAQVSEDRTGRLFAPGDPEALAGALRVAAADVTDLRRLGTHALEVARGSTHREMHRTRWRILAEHLGAS